MYRWIMTGKDRAVVVLPENIVGGNTVVATSLDVDGGNVVTSARGCLKGTICQYFKI